MVSSPQIDEADRGFSFIHDGPLDMRMDKSQEISAYDVVNSYDETELARIIFEYGEEKKVGILPVKSAWCVKIIL